VFSWQQELPYLPACERLGDTCVGDATATALATTRDGDGYWLTTANGLVFAFGDTRYVGSTICLDPPACGASVTPAAPITGIAPSPDGGGYWLVGADGGVFAFGAAPYPGSMAGVPLAKPVAAIAADPATGGYFELGEDGGVFAFAAPYVGSGAG
jgi:hypothetical protein